MSIRLRSRRGAIGSAWHAVALREAAEQLLGPARVGRGKADARAGRVQWLDIAPGVARADVLDADGELHQARLELPAFRADDRQVVLGVARAHPELPAKLAGGEYPQQIEAELAPSEISFLPRTAELSHDCSCPDWPGPCRHVGALVYVLVEAVDEQPQELLTLRGLTLGELVAPAGADRAAPGAPANGRGADPPSSDSDPAVDGTERAGAAESSPAASRFDPGRTDPGHLVEVLGEDVAAVLHAFYRAGADPEEDES